MEPKWKTNNCYEKLSFLIVCPAANINAVKLLKIRYIYFKRDISLKMNYLILNKK